MSRRSDQPSPAARPVVAAFQILLVLATLLAPIPVAAEDPSAPPTEPVATEPAATPDLTKAPTAEPTSAPADQPTAAPTEEPTVAPTDPPTAAPSEESAPAPTDELTVAPTDPPTLAPTDEPTTAPTTEPTSEPTSEPTTAPEPSSPIPTTEPSAPVAAPTIQSDLEDYPPGGLVTLTGANWQPGESVHIFVNDDFGSSWSRNVDVLADASGNITDQFNLPNWFVAVYSVVATGPSGSATTRFTDASLRILRAPTGNPPNLTFTISAAGFTNAACTTTTDQSGTDSALINSDSGSTDINLPNNAGNTFVRLTAPASPTTPSTGWTFKDWSSGTGSDNPITTTTASSICVRNPGGSQNDIYVATYRQAEVGTTTTASSSAATYGATSVTLNATVTPASGSPVGTGTVTFTVRKGATTVGSPVTSGTVSVGGASAPFSLTGVGADTYTISAVYNPGSGLPEATIQDRRRLRH